jgi:hypothetical protein
MVANSKQQRDQVAVDRYFTAAHLVEHVLRDVGKGNNRVEPEQPGRPLDGVRCAKYGTDSFLVVRLGFQVEQRLLHCLQEFARLNEEGLQRLVHVHAVFLSHVGGPPRADCIASNHRGEGAAPTK